jgi:translation initiation factor 2-alpha kinase 4
MYDGDWNDLTINQMAATCRKEGILWLVIVKPQHLSRGDQSLKVRGVLRGGEDEGQ